MTEQPDSPKLTQIMQLSLDLGNRAALVKQRDEVVRLLGIIEYALASWPDDFSQNGELFSHPTGQAIAAGDHEDYLLSLLPDVFTIRDVMAKAPAEMKMSRERAKHIIRKWVSSDAATLIRQGARRQAGVYGKTKDTPTK